MTRKYARTIRETRCNGWTAMWNEYRPAKADGTADMRHEPSGNARQLHTHANGHKRLYINNLLRAEKYTARETRSLSCLSQSEWSDIIDTRTTD